MKVLSFMLWLVSLPAFSQTLHIDDFHYAIPDIAHGGQKKEPLFTSMNRTLVRLGDSICSNRALMWVYDFKRKQKVESPKIFLFFTSKTGRNNWWYHVAPMVNEGGQYWVVDGGFPGMVKGPLSIKEWLAKFTGATSVCKEIKEGEDDLVERMFVAHAFPENTRYGRYDCYYKITPPGYWTPASVAKHLLGRDENGRPIHYVRDQIDEDEVYQACLEAATTPLGWALGTARRACSNYITTGVLKFD